MDIVMTKLPYPYEALEPHISRRTLEFHHDKHYRAYIEKTESLAKEAHLFIGQTLESVILKCVDQKAYQALFNNAAQVWNHAFYWSCLAPNGGGGAAKGEIARRINTDFGSYKSFAEEFAQKALGVFGTGWAWLVLDAGKLKIITTLDADTPIAHGLIPILTIDVWEHAYYLDYQNERERHIKTVIDHLLNWDFANQNLEKPHSHPN